MLREKVFIPGAGLPYELKCQAPLSSTVYKMEGSSISPLASQKEISQQWLEKVLSHKLATDVTVNSWIANAPETKDGFSSEISFVKVVYSSAGGAEEERNFVVKFMPENEELVKIMQAGNIPKREIGFYKYAKSEHFKTFCRTAGLAHPVPDVCWADVEEDKLTIVLDDLKTKGYKSSTPAEGNSLNEIKKALRSIAVIHASGTIEKKESKLVALGSPWDPGNFGEYFNIGLKKLIHMYDGLPTAETFKSLLPHSSNMVTISQKHSFVSTIVHGDLWAGNVMFSDMGDSACIFDWQVAHVGNPLSDVASLLLMSAEPLVYVEHLSEVLDHYWQSYQRSLQKNEIDINVSYHDMVTSLESLWIHGFMSVSMSLPFLLDHGKMTEERVRAVVSFLEERRTFDNFLQSCL